jgi:probable addiction module antidote protein
MRTFDKYLIDELKDQGEAKAHLELAIEEYEKDGDTASFMQMVRLIAEAQGGIAKLSERSHLNKQNLYKILTGKTTPRFDTTLSIMKGLGFKLNIESLGQQNQLH